MLKDLTFTKTPINNGKLRAEIGAAVGFVENGGKLYGVSTADPKCIVHVEDTVTPADETTIANTVAAHDPTPLPDQLIQAWQTIMSQAATRPLASMDITQVNAWINSNIADAGTRTALKEIAKELFITRAQMAIIARALAQLFA